jgi:hypothetical protein
MAAAGCPADSIYSASGFLLHSITTRPLTEDITDQPTHKLAYLRVES